MGVGMERSRYPPTISLGMALRCEMLVGVDRVAARVVLDVGEAVRHA